MHVLILPSWYPTERNPIAGVFFREQAVALRQVGHDIGVIHPELRSLRRWRSVLDGKHGIEYTCDDGVRTLRFHGMSWFPRLPRASSWLWVRHGLRLFDRYLRRWGRPDVLHVHSMLDAGVLALQIERRYGVPFIVTEHATAFARGVLKPWEIDRARAVARRARRRFAVSTPLCALLDEMLGSDAGTWEEMPNIVSRAFAAAPLRRRDRGDTRFRFVCVGLLDPKKGIHDLIRSFAIAFEDEPDVSLDIAGDGDQRAALEALTRSLGLANRIRFLGAVDRAQVVDIVSHADALVSSSIYETFGVVVIEALALGKPVVATRSGGPESIVRHADGLLVPVGDVHALADGMRRLRSGYDRYDSSSIRQACLARYGEAAVARRLTLAYAGVIGRGAHH